jgi:hypothetical protein
MWLLKTKGDVNNIRKAPSHMAFKENMLNGFL